MKETSMTPSRPVRAPFFLAVLPLFFTLTLAPCAEARPKVYDRVLRSTGFIVAQFPNKANVGTCWVVDRQRCLVITNCHVVNDRKLGKPKFIVVFFPHYSEGKLVRHLATYLKERSAVPGRAVAEDSPRDLALVQLDRVPEGIQALPLARRAPRGGARVYSVGNSGLTKKVGKKTRLKDNAKLWRLARGKVVRVEFFKAPKKFRRKAWPVFCKCIRVHARLNHGDSGGPVVNKRGELVGVVSSGNQRNLVWNIHVVEIKRFLRRITVQVLNADKGKGLTIAGSFPCFCCSCHLSAGTNARFQ
jgi:S1-C subfamily serine protease